MIHSDTKSLLVAAANERVSAALCRLNTIKDLLIAAEGKVQLIDGQIQAMTGNQQPRTNMAMPPMVNMANPFGASQHYQPPFQFNPGASMSGKLAAGNPAVFHFHPEEMRDQHPAPSIAHANIAQEEFFDAPFGIWLPQDDQQGNTCRPVLLHKNSLLLGLSSTKAHQLLQAPWPTALQGLRAIPGHEGLAAVLDSLCGA
jgi:hypothetical protein